MTFLIRAQHGERFLSAPPKAIQSQGGRIYAQLLNLKHYRIWVEANFNNNKVFKTHAEMNHYNFQVENIILPEILKRKTGQIILEGIRSSGHNVALRPHMHERSLCTAATLARSEMVRGL